MSADTTDPLLTTAEVAHRLGRSHELIGRYARQGRIPGAFQTSFGHGAWLIPTSSLTRIKWNAPGRPKKTTA